MTRIRRLGSLLAATALCLSAWPATASADPWPRERHGAWGSYRIYIDFQAGIDQPASPVGTLVAGPDGRYYGVAANGGPGSEGMVYRVTGTGTTTVLHVFDMSTGRDPARGLTLGSDGRFYGTTIEGGPFYRGVVYRMDLDGSYTVLHAFGDAPGGGRNPASRLVEGPDGNFYGTTIHGGTHHGHGTFFRMTPAGDLTTLYSFHDNSEYEPLITSDFCVAPDSHFYAMGRSAAFRIAMDGTTAELRRFDPQKHGRMGTAGLILGRDGYLYGAMAEGGPRQGGTVFRLSMDGDLKILHAFPGPADPGYAGEAYHPAGPLMQAADGSLYGTVDHGGKWGYGGIYRVVPGKGLRPVMDFAGWPEKDSYQPAGALVEHVDGFFLGTGGEGGLYSAGTLYVLDPTP